jgi:putative ABC transport system permease protein
VISYAWWNARYHRDPSVIGRTLLVQDVFSRPKPLVIVGVLPPEFHGMIAGENPRIYLPSYFYGPENRDANQNFSMLLFGRLKPGQTPASAETALQPLFQDWLREAIKDKVFGNHPTHARLVLKRDSAGYSGLGQEYGKGLQLLQLLVATILIAGCIYLSTLFSARAVVRRREFAVRAALGASRARLMSQSMLESALVVIAGTAAGIVLAWAAAQFLVHFLSTSSSPITLDVRPQGWILVFAAAISVLALAMTGLLPAWRASRANPIADIKESRLGVMSFGGNRIGSVLFPLQVALSLVVIVVSSLLSASLMRALTQDNGFALSGGVFVSSDIPWVLAEQDKDGKKLKAALALYDDLLDRLNHTPGVSSASADVTHPLGGATYGTSVSSKYRSMPEDDHTISLVENWIAPRYFETAGTRLIAGREFDRNDGQGAPLVCILSQSAARYFFPSGSALGETITEVYSKNQKPTVVGVVEDSRFTGMERAAPMMLYLPFRQNQGSLNSVEFFLRTDDVGGSVSVLRKLLHDRAGAHVMEVTPVSVAVKESLSRRRLLTTLSNTFAGLALLLSAIGIFGLLSYSVSQRTAEIGVRIALGASRHRVVGMMLSQAALLVVPGVLLGVVAAWAATRFIASFLYQTKPLDPVAFGVSIFALLVVSGVSSYLPARRAARIEPMEALRAE